MIKGEGFMKKFISMLLLTMFLNIPGTVLAKSVTVKSSTSIPVTFAKEITSKTVESGQKAEAMIAEDVVIDDVLVFKKGDRAYLNVSDTKKAGFVGSPGQLFLVNGQVYDVNGVMHGIDFNRKFVGEEKTWPKVCLGCGLLIILAPIALFGFVKGGQAKITTGQIIDVNLRNDFTFSEQL